MNSLTPTISKPSILGPACRFRIEGRTLCLGPKNDEMAIYREGRWHFAGRAFAILESEVPTLVHFEDDGVWRSSGFGPFAGVRIAGGRISHGPQFNKVLATFEEGSDSWRVESSGEHYSGVVLVPAPRADGSDLEKGSRTLRIPPLRSHDSGLLKSATRSV